MKKIFFFAAIAALALSSCSSDEIIKGDDPVLEEGSVLFSAYQGRATRAAGDEYEAGDLATTGNGDEQNVTNIYLKKNGFGVFAYEQGNKELVSYLAGNTYPNFMYNQHVAGCKTAAGTPHETAELEEDNASDHKHWNYSPLKYWPNNKDAKVTFQAYAPYDENVEATFGPAYGGVGIRYNTAEGKDLLWGANSIKEEGEADGVKYESTCYYDVKKPDIAATTDFYFKHALTKLDFTVSYITDKNHTGAGEDAAAGNIVLDENTKIVVRNIRLVGSLPSQGVLSLYDGTWTIERTAENTGFNTADLTLNGTGATLTENGTLTNLVSTIKPAKSMMVIPTAAGSPAVHIEITYDVITTDPSNASNNSIVTNTVSSKDNTYNLYPDGHTFSGVNLVAGNWTTVNIHLGLTSAKFTANVVKWDVTDPEKNVDLPNNKPAPSNRR